MKMPRINLLIIFCFLFITGSTARAQILSGREEKRHFDEGVKYYAEKEYELALRSFLEVLELNPENEIALGYVQKIKNELKTRHEKEVFLEGVESYERKEYEKALDRFVAVLRMNPQHREAIEYIQRIKEETTTAPKETEEKILPEEKKEIAPRREVAPVREGVPIGKKEVVKEKEEEKKQIVPSPAIKTTPLSASLRTLLIIVIIMGGLFAGYVFRSVMNQRRASRGFRLLRDLTRNATRTEPKEEILLSLLRAFQETFSARGGAIFTLEDKTGDFALVEGVGLSPHLSENFRFRKDEPVFDELAGILTPVTGEDIRQDVYEKLLLFKERPVVPSALLLIPLLYKGRSVGIILLNCRKGKRKVFLRMRHIMEILSNQAAIIIANISYNHQAIIDGLTGLYVHWFFYQCLEKEISRAERQNSSLALLMADLDNFKQFNDRYGHPVGDKALVRVAEILRRDLRDIDTVARYGGEEFAIILPGVDEKLALRTAERIRKNMERYRFSVADGKFLLTLSIGVAIYEKGISAKEMVERADKALYWVKQHGRNQVKSWSSISIV